MSALPTVSEDNTARAGDAITATNLRETHQKVRAKRRRNTKKIKRTAQNVLKRLKDDNAVACTNLRVYCAHATLRRWNATSTQAIRECVAEQRDV